MWILSQDFESIYVFSVKPKNAVGDKGPRTSETWGSRRKSGQNGSIANKRTLWTGGGMDGSKEAKQMTHHQSCWPAPPGPWLSSECLAEQMYSCPEEKTDIRQSMWTRALSRTVIWLQIAELFYVPSANSLSSPPFSTKTDH